MVALYLDNAIPLSEDIRDHGGWIATCVATLMICISIYTMQLEIQIESSMEHNLRLALTKQQFELFISPKLIRQKTDWCGSLVKMASSGFRVYSNKRVYSGSGNFGLMPEIGEWVLAQACQVLQDWSKKKRLKILRFQSILVLIILCNLTLSTL